MPVSFRGRSQQAFVSHALTLPVVRPTMTGRSYDRPVTLGSAHDRVDPPGLPHALRRLIGVFADGRRGDLPPPSAAPDGTQMNEVIAWYVSYRGW